MKKNLKGIMATASMLALVLTLTQDVSAANTVTATPSTHTFSVDGEVKPMAAYVINGNNYLKLRDIAAVINGTPKQFEVGWDAGKNAINLTSNKAYTPNGSELTKGSGGAVTAQVSTAKVYKDSALANYAGYNIAGNNYYKLRDVAESFDIGVEWDGATMTSNIVAGQATDDNDQNQGNEQGGDQTESTMKEVSNNSGYFYDTSLLIVPPEIPKISDLTLSVLKQRMPDLEQRLRNWELCMVDLVNEERRNAGLNELVIDEDTMGRAQYWAEHMASGDYRHATRSEAREYAKIAGLTDMEPSEINGVTDKKTNDKVANVGENIAGTPLIGNPVERMMKALMNSPGHKAAILDADAKTIGTGLAVSEKGAIYCCQNFGLVLYED